MRLVDVTGDPTGYARLLVESWDYANGTSGLAIVEQDNVLRADIANAFHECERGWCSYPYDWTDSRGPALGMTRFRGSFIAEHPDAMRYAAEQPSAAYYGFAGEVAPEGPAPGHWKSVGWFLTDGYLKFQRKVMPHVHLPACEHLNEKQRLTSNVDLSDEEHLRLLGYTEWAA